MPYWAEVNDGGNKGILFRGTWHELKAAELTITLKNKINALTSKDIGSKVVPLSEVVDVNYAQADMVIHKKEKSSKVEFDDDEQLDKDAQTCTIQGSVNIGSEPKWRQKGEDDVLQL